MRTDLAAGPVFPATQQCKRSLFPELPHLRDQAGTSRIFQFYPEQSGYARQERSLYPLYAPPSQIKAGRLDLVLPSSVAEEINPLKHALSS